MIAVISSTIYPPSLPTYDGQRTCLSPEERIEQTQKTIESLVNLGISEIYLADNSGENWVLNNDKSLKYVKIHIFSQYQYKKKGISELYLLLNILEYIPSNKPILKISGRYTLNKNIINNIGDADLAGRLYRHSLVNSSMSTRCYLVKNKDIFAIFLKRTLREVYAYPSRIVGPRSFVRILHNSLFPSKDNYPSDDPTGSIEGAAARVLHLFNYKFNNIEPLGIQGFVAGNPNDLLKE